MTPAISTGNILHQDSLRLSTARADLMVQLVPANEASVCFTQAMYDPQTGMGMGGGVVTMPVETLRLVMEALRGKVLGRLTGDVMRLRGYREEKYSTLAAYHQDFLAMGEGVEGVVRLLDRALADSEEGATLRAMFRSVGNILAMEIQERFPVETKPNNSGEGHED